jgi:hypothetical protein
MDFLRGRLLAVLTHWIVQLIRPNVEMDPDFIRSIQRVVEAHAPRLSGLCDRAKLVGNGVVYVIDGRCEDPDGEVPPEDIIGAFLVSNGANR